MNDIRIIEASRLLMEVRELKFEKYSFICMFETESEADGMQLKYLFDREGGIMMLKLDVSAGAQIESITADFPAAGVYEEELAEKCGINFIHAVSAGSDDEEGRAKGRVPFGPQHPLFAEPLLWEVAVSEGKAVNAVPVTGFTFRGAEKLAESRGCRQAAVIMERICGSNSFGHSWGVTAALEKAKNIRIPERALYIRTILMELTRIQSHIMNLAMTADAAGFESLSADCWTVRESVLDILESMTGSRIIHSMCRIGGVRNDIDEEILDAAADLLIDVKEQVNSLADVFLEDASMINRLQDSGKIEETRAVELCAAGPAARGCGIITDARLGDRLGVYDKIGFEAAVSEGGDCCSRCRVRIEEIFRSADMVIRAVENMPGGPVYIDTEGSREGEAAVRLELADGEALYYAKCSGDELKKIFVNTASARNMAAVSEMLAEAELSDVPMIIISADIKAGGMER